MSKKPNFSNWIAQSLGITDKDWNNVPDAVQDAITKRLSPKNIRIYVFNPIEYNAYHIFVQKIGSVFQFIVHKDGLFYQGHNVLLEKNGVWTDKEMESTAGNLFAQAKATCDLIDEQELEKVKALSNASGKPGTLVS